jgi:hypothetical protein
MHMALVDIAVQPDSFEYSTDTLIALGICDVIQMVHSLRSILFCCTDLDKVNFKPTLVSTGKKSNMYIYILYRNCRKCLLGGNRRRRRRHHR